MLIKSLEVTGFLGRTEPLLMEFHSDFNIITGHNGSGKTNLLKLLWYVISGNTYALLNEVRFQSLVLITDIYTIRLSKISNNTCRGTFQIAGDSEEIHFQDEMESEDEDFISDARDQFDRATRANGSSIFFPTFRRIEGGFTINQTSKNNINLFNAPKQKGDLPEAISAISRKLSNNDHTFVASVSTFDIAELMLRQFNELSDESNILQSKMSRDVIDKIRVFRRDTARDSLERVGEEAVETLTSIQNLIEEVDKERARVMAPMRAVQEVVSKIFKHKGIQINRRVNFGDAVNAISSDLLSAGEKQMLSFICYNAFIDHSPIFIDEPELSLHVDWQRILFPTLEAQEKDNQFIIATHSPFIYSKYPEKEVRLVEYRGGEIYEDE